MMRISLRIVELHIGIYSFVGLVCPAHHHESPGKFLMTFAHQRSFLGLGI